MPVVSFVLYQTQLNTQRGSNRSRMANTVALTTMATRLTSNGTKQNSVVAAYLVTYDYEWGGRTRRPMPRDHFLIYVASPSSLFRQFSHTSDKVQYRT
jgi:hypothetical protein